MPEHCNQNRKEKKKKKKHSKPDLNFVNTKISYTIAISEPKLNEYEQITQGLTHLSKNSRRLETSLSDYSSLNFGVFIVFI